MYYTYMLRCEDNSIYTGITTDLERRVSEHLEKKEKCAKYTKKHSAQKLETAWKSSSRSLASKLEFNIKKLTKAQKEEIICSQDLEKYLSEKIDIKEYQVVNGNHKRIVIFGGSFNPPLNSHFSLAEQIVNEYENIDRIIFVPVNSKYEKAELLSNSHRYNMLKLVCDKNINFEVSDLEIKSDRALYTIETLTKLQKKYKNYELLFTMGTDNLKSLHTWKKSQELLDKFKILVLERDEDTLEEITNANPFLKKNANSLIKVKNNVRSNLSSTFVRNKIKEGKSIRYLTPEEVYLYIEKNKLFKNV